MNDTVVPWMVVAEIALLGGICLALPRIGRRGLLFGAYVGEAVSNGDEARSIRWRWDRGILLWVALSTAAAAAIARALPGSATVMAPMLPLVVAIVVLYLRRYREARVLAGGSGASVAPLPAAAGLGSGARDPLPWIALVVAVTGGIAALVYAAQNYQAMPARIPLHFDAAGAPDGWADRSFGSVFVMPLITLVMGIVIGGAAVLTARAKRALRARDGGVSLEAQERFRRAVARFLSIVAILDSLMLATMSIYATRAAVGASPGLPAWILATAGAMALFTVGGVIYLMIRYGQGGARLEAGSATAPLTDGLADNRLWKLGLFYVNRDDPSWLVEKRFGFGYTVNFGNPAATATIAALLVMVFALAIWAIVSS